MSVGRTSVSGMTTLAERPHTALLLIDVQVGVVADAYERDAVVANIATLVDRARDEGVQVVWVQHSDENVTQGSEAWQYVPELTRRDPEPLVPKHYPDSFEGTSLEEVLAEARVGRLVVAGASTDACIRSTIHGAFVRGYDVTLVGDAHTTSDLSKWGAPPPEQVIAHTNLYWKYHVGAGAYGCCCPGEGSDVRKLIPSREVAVGPLASWPVSGFRGPSKGRSLRSRRLRRFRCAPPLTRAAPARFRSERAARRNGWPSYESPCLYCVPGRGEGARSRLASTPGRLSGQRPVGQRNTGDGNEDSGANPRFADAVRELGLVDLLGRIRRFPDATRTAAEAAAAIGCELSEICKSLIFAADGVPVLVLMDGASRVDVELVRRELGVEKVTRAKVDVVRETTGYAIGGCRPLDTVRRPGVGGSVPARA
jgi:hypothetical protein